MAWTWKPSVTSRPTIARPIPPDAPVTAAVRGRPSQVLAQAQRVVDRGVGVAPGNGVADAEQLVAVSVGELWPAVDQRRVVDLRRRCDDPLTKAWYSSSLASTP